MKPSAFRRVLQIAAFVRKEALEIVRQPRLLLTLVFGPFLIMAVFGLGYRDTPDPMRTIFVAPKGSPLLDQAQTYAKDAGPFVTLVGVTNDPTAARQRLMDGDVDLVVSFPDDPLSTVLAGQQASIRVIHTRLDPIQRTAISFASRLAIDQINGQILAQIVEGGQGLARPASEAFSLATGAISSLDQAISSQDQARADAALADLEDATARLSLSARAVDAASERLMGDRATRDRRGRDWCDRRASPERRGPAVQPAGAGRQRRAWLGSVSSSTPSTTATTSSPPSIPASSFARSAARSSSPCTTSGRSPTGTHRPPSSSCCSSSAWPSVP